MLLLVLVISLWNKLTNNVNYLMILYGIKKQL